MPGSSFVGNPMEESNLARILRVFETLAPDIKSFGILTAYDKLGARLSISQANRRGSDV